MHEALLSEKLPQSQVRCNICNWRCVISPSKYGVCRMYQNRNGTLYNLNYGKASSVAVDPIEKKPLCHFYPGSRVFSLGSWGCNFHCPGCQNWEIACPVGETPWAGARDISPQAAVDTALAYHCQGIAWTYNEPTMWFEYTLDSARLAKEHNLYTVYVTNGYMTIEALDLLGPYLDAWRVDIKGFRDTYYRQIARITHWEKILETTRRAREKWLMHVEVVTNIVPTMNDSEAELTDLADWIKNNLGELTPWHITRFYPQRELADLPPTPPETIERAYEIGRRAGLKFVYAGNLPGHKSESTVCYACGKLVVSRTGYVTEVTGLKGDCCRYCGAELNFRPRKAREVTHAGTA
jgi:pyruvate formate lyase activating enzyme